MQPQQTYNLQRILRPSICFILQVRLQVEVQRTGHFVVYSTAS